MSAPPTSRRSPVDDLARWMDDRLRLAEGSRKYLDKAFPGHWSFLLGEIALFTLVVLLFTGTFLAFFYTPDSRLVVYDGPYVPLQGQEISAAYESTLRISFEVRAGPADAPDPPLGGARVRRRHRGPHAAGVLHRVVPQAP
jgi:ubiquinol-cytochrome c reductase cytochrome b subunit